MSQAMEQNNTNHINFLISAASSIILWIGSQEIDIVFRFAGSIVSIVTGLLAIRGYLREEKKHKNQ